MGAASVEKHELRARLRRMREKLDPAACARHEEALARLLTGLDELRAVSVVLAHAATSDELDPAIAVRMLEARGVRVAYPRIEPKARLGLHFADPSELEPSRYGIREPAISAPRAAYDEIDAVLVPGLAFDERGLRLGRGGGYYDRLLPLLRPDAVRIGIAYDEQVLERIPAEDHDVEMDLVVTPTRVLRPGRPR